MELLQLKYFMDAAKYENFSKAAQHNFVPPSSISKAVKILEKEFNISLFDRHGKKIYLNEHGKYLYRHVSNIFNELDDCTRHFGIEKSNQLAIYIQDGYFFMPFLVSDFIRVNPNTYISYTPVQVVLHSSKIPYDFTFMQLQDQMDNFEYEHLLTDEMILLVSENHPFANRTEVDITELKEEHVVSFYSTISQRILIDRLCNDIGHYTPTYTFETHDEFAVLHLVALNEGITFMPDKFYHTHPFPGIKAIKLKESISSNLVIAWDRHKKLNQIEKTFLNYCIEWFKKR